MALAYPKRDTSYLGHDETSSGHDVSHMHLTQIASLRTLTEPFRFSRFNIITNASTNKKLTGAWGCEFGVVNRRTKLRPDSRLDLVNSTVWMTPGRQRVRSGQVRTGRPSLKFRGPDHFSIPSFSP